MRRMASVHGSIGVSILSTYSSLWSSRLNLPTYFYHSVYWLQLKPRFSHKTEASL